MTEFEERAAIMQYDGGMTREAAERMAMFDLQVRGIRQQASRRKGDMAGPVDMPEVEIPPADGSGV